MNAFLQHHLGLVIVSAFTLVALLVLTAVGWQMHAARLSLRPVVFVGVFFAIVCVPQWLVHGTAALWRKPQPVLDEAAIAGSGAFSRPDLVFGPDVDRARLRDARPVFAEALSNAEAAQLWIQDSGETAVAARFADDESAQAGAAALWAMFSPRDTSGDGMAIFGTRAAGDTVGLQRVGRAVFAWAGPDRASVEARMRRSQAVALPADARPRWLAAFDDWRVAGAAVAWLVVLACVWFFKGAAWAARTAPAEGVAPIGAAALENRLAALPGLIRLGDGRWELVTRHAAMWESGAYRYVLELDVPRHRVKVLEYLASREVQADGPQWRLQRGITFFRKELDIDAQQPKAAVQRTVLEAGWAWQPLMLDAPPALAWLVG